MTLNIFLEILEFLKLKASPQESGNVAPTGNSDHPFYKTSGWKSYLWKYIVVVDQNFLQLLVTSQVFCLSQLM